MPDDRDPVLLIKCRLLSETSSTHVTISEAAEQLKQKVDSHLARH